MAPTEITINDVKHHIISNLRLQIDCLSNGLAAPIPFLSGRPGIGKSAIMRLIAEELEMGLNVKYIGTMLVEQFGLPLPMLPEKVDKSNWVMEKSGEMVNPHPNTSSQPRPIFQRWSHPDLFSTENIEITPPTRDSYTILFLDDIHLATKTIQNYLFQLLMLRSIHGKRMSDKFLMVAAGNRSMDKAGFQPIMAPIANRFNFKDVIATAADWLDNFAYYNDVRWDITSFIEKNPQMLQSEPLESRPWASPRSWTYTSQELDQYEKDNGDLTNITELMRVVSGMIGPEYAGKFVEYKQLFAKWDAHGMINENIEIPNPNDLGDMDCYSLLTVLNQQLLIELTANPSFDYSILIKFYEDMIENHKVIIPLGLRSILMSKLIDKETQVKLITTFLRECPALMECSKGLLAIG